MEAKKRARSRRREKAPWGWAVTLLLVVYFFFSMAVYSVRHPEKTQTQVWMSAWDAVRFR